MSVSPIPTGAITPIIPGSNTPISDMGAEPRPQPHPITSPPIAPTLLRPLAEYEAVTAGAF